MPKCHVQQGVEREKLKKTEADSTYMVVIISLDIKTAQEGTCDLCKQIQYLIY